MPTKCVAKGAKQWFLCDFRCGARATKVRTVPRSHDVWFFLQQMHASVNENIIKQRAGKTVSEYAAWCSQRVREASPKLLMQGLGEVINITWGQSPCEHIF